MAQRRRTKAKRAPTGAGKPRTRDAKGRPGGAEAGVPAISELLDMNQAVEMLKISRPTFYRWLRAGKIKGMKLGRQWRFYREDIERFLAGQEPRIDLPADISPLIETLRKRLTDLGVGDPAAQEDNDVLRAVALMIRLGVAMQASDIHIEPFRKGEGDQTVAMLRYRVDGVLHPAAEIDLRLLPAIDERWKIMADCDVHEKHRSQDGRIVVKLGDIGRLIDLRVNFLHATLGPSVTARILDPDAVRPLTIERVGLNDRDRDRLLRALDAPSGAIFVVGPTGCGKTTTLYGCLNRLAGPERKVMAVENPVEFLLPWVVQTQLRPDKGVTFATTLRAFLRAAPNVILVGEIRDLETAELTLAAALTGHLVLTTLHTKDAPLALARLLEVGVDPFIVADATKLIVAQRLVRKLCPACSAEAQPAASRIEEAAQLARAGGLDWDALPKTFRAPRGCPKCHQTGFRGREVIAEALEMTPEIGAALRRGASTEELRTIAVGQGMTTMAADGIRRAAMGTTSLDEALRVLRGS